MVRTGMTRAFGAVLRRIVAISIRIWPRAFFAGLGVTGLLQSSTAVLLASLAARELIAPSMALLMITSVAYPILKVAGKLRESRLRDRAGETAPNGKPVTS
jgi:hypothetical protein